MFRSAHFKLTAWYLSIIMLITVVFSVVIYAVVSHQIEGLIHMQNDRIRRFQSRPPNEMAPPPDAPTMLRTEDLQKQEQQLLYTLIFIDLGIGIIAGGAGYFLAGRTLRPIKIMIDEQNQFISNASHELRTPIATLRAEMEGSLLEHHLSDDQARKLITSNLEELSTLQNLTDDLLKLTKVHSLHNHNQQEKLSIAEIVASAHKKVMALARQKNTLIKVSLQDAIIVGDKNSLTELFVILLDNAIKYSPNESEISVISEKTQNYIKIMVQDTGIGISETDLPHIFERFYRADKSRSQSEGYGLGLSIAKKIVENNRGIIEASSQLEKGTVFTLQLPLSSSFS
ncbi:GHKL domain-containing protein [Candidatus Roizmanbacteria bacterium]|nr:GHKL domain-containing protein [Candidatus Roizmanbacteria bacterium]